MCVQKLYFMSIRWKLTLTLFGGILQNNYITREADEYRTYGGQRRLELS